MNIFYLSYFNCKLKCLISLKVEKNVLLWRIFFLLFADFRFQKGNKIYLYKVTYNFFFSIMFQYIFIQNCIGIIIILNIMFTNDMFNDLSLELLLVKMQ